MLEKCFFLLVSISVAFGAATGRMQEVSNAVVDGAAKSVTLVLGLLGAMCLWSGIMEVLREAGAVQRLAHLLSPVLRHVFPETWKSGNGREEVCAALAANILGIGNAATPLALAAMDRMQKANPQRARATDDMVTFAVLGVFPLSFLPTTIIALRRAAGSGAPYRILLPVWLCSLCCSACGVVLCRLWAALSQRVFAHGRKGTHHD